MINIGKMMRFIRRGILSGAFLVFPFLLHAAPINFTTKQPLKAYNPADPKAQIGTFEINTALDIDDFTKPGDGFVAVVYKQADGKEIKAICQKSDLTNSANGSFKYDSANSQFLGKPIVAGKKILFEPVLRKELVKLASEDGNPEYSTAKAAISFPKNFDPNKPWPVFIVNVTVDGAASSVGAMNNYYKEANDLGWVVIAADGPEKPKNDDINFRWAMLQAALETFHDHWPTSTQWEYMAGGHSGGAKRSAYIGALLLKNKYKLIGMFMSGCNEDRTKEAWDHYRPPATYRSVPVFLSSGEKDKTATPSQHEDVKSSLIAGGFKKVRLESHPGGHTVCKEHVLESLKWFIELASAPPAAAKTSP